MNYNNIIQNNNEKIDSIYQELIKINPVKENIFLQDIKVLPSNKKQEIVAIAQYDGINSAHIIGDVDLKPENIRANTQIFGITGVDDGQYIYSNEEDALITRSLAGVYINDRVTTIDQYAFANCSSLASVSFPSVETIGERAFANCTSLTSVSFPVATSIGSYAFSSCSSLTSVSFPHASHTGHDTFRNCTSLTSVNFPVASMIVYCAFADCQNLTSVSFPVATSIGHDAFYNCTNLTSVNFPAVTSIAYYAFYNCTNLTSVNFPAVTSIAYYAFYNCTSLTSASFPSVKTIGDSAFNTCKNLTSVSFPACTSIGSHAFNYCYNLKSLYLTGSSVCQLSNSNAFTSTPIGGYSASAGTYGSIYVPSSLVASYQAATNWAYFSSRIVAYVNSGPTHSGGAEN